jgi:hypothetical protein
MAQADARIGKDLPVSAKETYCVTLWLGVNCPPLAGAGGGKKNNKKTECKSDAFNSITKILLFKKKLSSLSSTAATNRS